MKFVPHVDKSILVLVYSSPLSKMGLCKKKNMIGQTSKTL
jgi:hypothetical protein